MYTMDSESSRSLLLATVYPTKQGLQYENTALSSYRTEESTLIHWIQPKLKILTTVGNVIKHKLQFLTQKLPRKSKHHICKTQHTHLALHLHIALLTTDQMDMHVHVRQRIITMWNKQKKSKNDNSYRC